MKDFLPSNWQSILTETLFGDQWMIHAPLAPGMLLNLYEQSLSTKATQTTFDKRAPLNTVFCSMDDDDAYGSLDDAPANVVAVIPLKGVMIKYSTWWIYGALEIAAAIKELGANEKVIGIVLDCDSGGGSANAIAPIIQAIKFVQSMGKPVIASVDLCASACYWVATECDQIISDNNISGYIGSIGSMWSFLDVIPYFEKEGLKYHEVYSNLSGHKNKIFKDALKEDYSGLKTEMLDPNALKFQNQVKEKRKGKLNETVEGILNGRMFWQDKAFEYGLIDVIGDGNTAVKKALEIAHINNYLNT